MKNRRRLTLVVALVSSLGAVAPLGAQSGFEIGPLFGYYLPTGHFAPAPYFSTVLPTQPSDLSGAAWGAEAHLWFRPRWGIQLEAAVAGSTIGAVITPEGQSGPTSAQVFIASAQAQYDLSARPGTYNLLIGAGPALIRHQGDAYSGFGSPISVGAALGISGAIPIGAGFRVEGGVEALLYQLAVKDSPTEGGPGNIEERVPDGCAIPFRGELAPAVDWLATALPE